MRVSTLTLRFGQELSSAVKDLALRKHLTPYIVLLAAFQALLSRLTGQKCIVVGSPMAGRQQVETEKLIGLFVNLVALKTDIDEKDSFLDLLKKVKETAAEAQAHQHVPFERVVEVVEQERGFVTYAHCAGGICMAGRIDGRSPEAGRINRKAASD